MQSENGGSNLDLLTRHALDRWCVPCHGTPDGVAADTTLETSSAIDDAHMVAMYQLWTLWARDLGENVDDEAWAKQFAGLVLEGMVVPIVVWDGTLPVACADATLFVDPFTGKRCIHGDHAYVLSGYRQMGCLDRIFRTCMFLRDFFGCQKGYIPTSPEGAASFLRAHYEMNIDDGWTVKPKTVVLHVERTI